MPFIPVLFFLVVMPLTAGLMLIGPFYAGMCVGMLLIYGDTAAAQFYDPSYVVEGYKGLWAYLGEYKEALDLTGFLLPAFGPPLLGAGFGFFLFYLLASYVRSIFRV